MRIGIGYDIHRLVEDRPLFLGGVEISYMRGLKGHSDGDALLHAICDAILGAAGLNDIGCEFPNTDPEYKGVSSLELLKETVIKIKDLGYMIDYVDSVVISEEPKISPFKLQMKEKIAESIGIDKNNINIKATTQEGVGAIGRGEAIAAYSVVTITKSKIKDQISK